MSLGFDVFRWTKLLQRHLAPGGVLKWLPKLHLKMCVEITHTHYNINLWVGRDSEYHEKINIHKILAFPNPRPMQPHNMPGTKPTCRFPSSSCRKKKNFFFFLLTYLQASLVAQTVENLPAVRETQAPFLGQEDPLEIGSEVVLPWLGETVVESPGPKKCSRFMSSNLVLGAQVQTPPPRSKHHLERGAAAGATRRRMQQGHNLFFGGQKDKAGAHTLWAIIAPDACCIFSSGFTS